MTVQISFSRIFQTFYSKVHFVRVHITFDVPLFIIHIPIYLYFNVISCRNELWHCEYYRRLFPFFFGDLINTNPMLYAMLSRDSGWTTAGRIFNMHCNMNKKQGILSRLLFHQHSLFSYMLLPALPCDPLHCHCSIEDSSYKELVCFIHSRAAYNELNGLKLVTFIVFFKMVSKSWKHFCAL